MPEITENLSSSTPIGNKGRRVIQDIPKENRYSPELHINSGWEIAKLYFNRERINRRKFYCIKGKPVLSTRLRYAIDQSVLDTYGFNLAMTKRCRSYQQLLLTFYIFKST